MAACVCDSRQANKFAGWLATSAKENINVEEAVGALVDKILQNAERNCLLERSQGPSLDERVRSLELYRELHGNDVRSSFPFSIDACVLRVCVCGGVSRVCVCVCVL